MFVLAELLHLWLLLWLVCLRACLFVGYLLARSLGVPWSIQSLGSRLAIILSKLLTSLVQSIIKYSEFPCSRNLRVRVSKGTCSHDRKYVGAVAGLRNNDNNDNDDNTNTNNHTSNEV